MMMQDTLTSREIQLMMMVMVAVLTRPLSASVPHLGLQRSTFLERGPVDDALFTEDILQEVRARSRIECSKKCVETEGCAMCTFHSSPQGRSPPGLCRLHSELQTRADGWTSKAGARSFSRRRLGSCQDEDYVPRCCRCLKAISSSASYGEAKQACLSSQGYLVMPKTPQELACIRNFTMTNGLTRSWLGGDDSQEPGVFRWNDGTLLPNTSSLWARNEPDIVDPGKNCLKYRDSTSKIFDDVCSEHTYPYVCQKDYV